MDFVRHDNYWQTVASKVLVSMSTVQTQPPKSWQEFESEVAQSGHFASVVNSSVNRLWDAEVIWNISNGESAGSMRE